jgi:ABC-type glycerol-3-phosphate transport system permease component
MPIAQRSPGIRATRLITHALVHLVLAGGSLLVLFPLYWMISTSVKPLDQYYTWPRVWVPSPVTFEAYVRLLTVYPWLQFLRNTLLITAVATLGTIISCTIVAYGFTYFRAPGRDLLFGLLLSTMMLPSVVTLVPHFVLFRLMRWVDTYYPLTVPSFFGSAFYIFLLRQFYRTLPHELNDAARIDGCSELGILWRIVLPLCGSVLAAVAIFQFQGHWNDFMGPLIYLNSFRKSTLALALYSLRGEPGGTTPTQIMAGGTLMTLPVILAFAFFQRHFVQGVALTGIKG